MINNRYGSEVNMPLLAALIIIIISFSSIWVTWLKIEAKAYGNSVDETLDFTDIMDADEKILNTVINLKIAVWIHQSLFQKANMMP